MTGFENFGRVDDEPLARMECGVCWTVFDPVEGDTLGRAEPGTPFAVLPQDWRCPTCDAAPHQFMRVDDGR